MSTKRKAISRTTRFEVFKRDKFTCQYCGSKAPEVVLHVDHIKPVAGGGANNILNLVTACDVCNGGKGARELTDDSAVRKHQASAESLQERREQLEMMLEWHKGLADIDGAAVRGIAALYSTMVPGWNLNDSGLSMVRSMVSANSVDAVISALRSAAGRYVTLANGKATQESVDLTMGVWRRTIQYARDPVGSELRYVRGILRNVLTRKGRHCNESASLKLLQQAHEAGVALGDLRSLALDAHSQASWEREVESAIADAEEFR